MGWHHDSMALALLKKGEAPLPIDEIVLGPRDKDEVNRFHGLGGSLAGGGWEIFSSIN